MRSLGSCTWGSSGEVKGVSSEFPLSEKSASCFVSSELLWELKFDEVRDLSSKVISEFAMLKIGSWESKLRRCCLQICTNERHVMQLEVVGELLASRAATPVHRMNNLLN